MALKTFRSPAAYQNLDQNIYRGLYAGSPNAYLVLTPDLKIINGNDAFVAMSRIERSFFAGRYMFDAFPDNPADPANDGVKMLMESFNRVLKTQRTDTLKFQRYDVKNQNGIWENRHWNGTSWPIIDDDKLITAVILHVNELKSDEVAQVLDDARLQVQKSKKLVDTGKKLADQVERLVREVRQGRLASIQTLRELLQEWDITIH